MCADTTVVLIGAARSGTKILRDALGVATGAGVVPYDVGYVWRYGNEFTPDDVLDPYRVKPRTRRLVQSFLDRYREGGVVIEKSVGNALRVPFVHAILPEAKFIHIVRDGVAVAESAARQWTASTDWRYLRGKAAHFPLRLVPTYGMKFVVNATLRRRSASHSRAATWGPRYPGIDEDIRNEGLLVTCARQWRECVSRASAALNEMPGHVAEVRYEDLVARPAEVLAQTAAGLGLAVDAGRVERAAGMVRPPTGPSAREILRDEQLAVLDHEIGPQLEELRYARPR